MGKAGARQPNGERTRPACSFGRLAQNLVPQSASLSAEKSW